MVLQVLLLMWLRTTINIQLATGSGFFATMRHLYREGGVARFYQGLWIALLSAPLARFGDTAANEGALALLEASALPVAAKTLVASPWSSVRVKCASARPWRWRGRRWLGCAAEVTMAVARAERVTVVAGRVAV